MIILQHKLNAIILLLKTLQWFLHFSDNGIVTHHKARPWPQPCLLSELFAVTHCLRGNNILHFLLPLGLGPSSALCLGSSAFLRLITGCLFPPPLCFLLDHCSIISFFIDSPWSRIIRNTSELVTPPYFPRHWPGFPVTSLLVYRLNL